MALFFLFKVDMRFNNYNSVLTSAVFVHSQPGVTSSKAIASLARSFIVYILPVSEEVGTQPIFPVVDAFFTQVSPSSGVTDKNSDSISYYECTIANLYPDEYQYVD